MKKKILAISLAVILLFSASFPAFAAPNTPKTEVVYGMLDYDGRVDGIYVVNIFDLAPPAKLVDYGDYARIRNMNTTDRLSQTGDEIRGDTGAGRLYYEGTMKSKELPWLIDITYYLDGAEISADNLGGKSGHLTIDIHIEQNQAVNSTFFACYALQVTLALDSSSSKNVVAQNATIAQVGGKQQFTYTVLPGKGANINLGADVIDFELDPIVINGLRLAMDVPADYGRLLNQAKELQSALLSLDNGAGYWVKGAADLHHGQSDFQKGIAGLQSGAGTLAGGVSQLTGGIEQLQAGLETLSGQSQSLTDGSLQFKAGLEQLSISVNQLAEVNPPLAELARALDALLEQYAMLDAGITGYTQGVASITDNNRAMVAGGSELNQGAKAVADHAAKLSSGAVALGDGLNGLYKGAVELKAGTSMLREKTAGMDREIAQGVGELLGGVSEGNTGTISFASAKNDRVEAVQFVLKTKAIEIKQAAVPSAAAPVKLTWWQKFLKLFGLYRD